MDSGIRVTYVRTCPRSKAVGASSSKITYRDSQEPRLGISEGHTCSTEGVRDMTW